MTDTTDKRHLPLLEARALFALVLDAIERLELTPYHVKISPKYAPPEVEVYLDTDDWSDVRRLASALGLVGPLLERSEDVTRYDGRRQHVEYGLIDADRDTARAADEPYWHLWASRTTDVIPDELEDAEA